MTVRFGLARSRLVVALTRIAGELARRGFAASKLAGYAEEPDQRMPNGLV
jgi:hypothetical protein